MDWTHPMAPPPPPPSAKKRAAAKAFVDQSSAANNNESAAEEGSKLPRVDKRQYKKAWEDVPELQGWLTPADGNPQRAWCRYCRISLRAHRRDLVDHSLTERHMRNAVEAAGLDNESDDLELDSSRAKESSPPSAEVVLGDLEAESANNRINDDGFAVMDTFTADRSTTNATGERNPSVAAALTRVLRNSQQQIMVVQAGGTIDKVFATTTTGGSACAVADAAYQRIFDRVGLELPITFRSACRKEGQQLNVDDRFLIYDCCASSTQRRILITHDVDGLLETASYLSSFEDLSSKVIVLTGATRPEMCKDSDADFNIGVGVGCVQTLPTAGVYICMHGFVARWDQVEQDVLTNKLVRRRAVEYF